MPHCPTCTCDEKKAVKDVCECGHHEREHAQGHIWPDRCPRCSCEGFRPKSPG